MWLSSCIVCNIGVECQTGSIMVVFFFILRLCSLITSNPCPFFCSCCARRHGTESQKGIYVNEELYISPCCQHQDRMLFNCSLLGRQIERRNSSLIISRDFQKLDFQSVMLLSSGNIPNYQVGKRTIVSPFNRMVSICCSIKPNQS